MHGLEWNLVSQIMFIQMGFHILIHHILLYTLTSYKCLHDELHLITGVEPVTSTQGNTAETFAGDETLFRQLVQPFNYSNSTSKLASNLL